MNASRVVLAEGVFVVSATTITSFARGDGFPRPAVFLGGAVAFGALVALAGPAPDLAVSLGGLTVAYGLLRASKPGGPSVGEILVQALTGAGKGTLETPGSGKTTQPSSITPVVAAAPATAAATPAAAPSSQTAAGATRASGSLVYPFAGGRTGLSLERVDRGQDFGFTAPKVAQAVASGTVVGIYPGFGPSDESIFTFVKLDKPLGGYQYLYYGGGQPVVKVGDRVSAGTPIAHFVPGNQAEIGLSPYPSSLLPPQNAAHLAASGPVFANLISGL